MIEFAKRWLERFVFFLSLLWSRGFREYSRPTIMRFCCWFNGVQDFVFLATCFCVCPLWMKGLFPYSPFVSHAFDLVCEESVVLR